MSLTTRAAPSMAAGAALTAAEPSNAAAHGADGPQGGLSRWQRAAVAIGGLLLAYGVGLAVLAAGGAVVHAVQPARRFDLFAALHDQWVVGALLGITVLWLLPPYPWAKRVITLGSREQPAATAGGAEDGGAPRAAAHLEVSGPGAALRPIGRRSAHARALGRT